MDPKKKKKPPIHEELEGFDINVNSFGELESTLDIDKINEFLNNNLEDKKVPDDEKVSPLLEESDDVLDEEESLPLKEDDDEWDEDEEWEEE